MGRSAKVVGLASRPAQSGLRFRFRRRARRVLALGRAEDFRENRPGHWRRWRPEGLSPGPGERSAGYKMLCWDSWASFVWTQTCKRAHRKSAERTHSRWNSEKLENACWEARSEAMRREISSPAVAPRQPRLRSALVVLVVAAPPDARLVASPRGAVEPQPALLKNLPSP